MSTFKSPWPNRIRAYSGGGDWFPANENDTDQLDPSKPDLSCIYERVSTDDVIEFTPTVTDNTTVGKITDYAFAKYIGSGNLHVRDAIEVGVNEARNKTFEDVLHMIDTALKESGDTDAVYTCNILKEAITNLKNK